jgi:CRP-like cAMP-binding protein
VDGTATPLNRRSFDAEAFLNSPGMSRKVAAYPPATTVFVQGDPSDTIFYIQQGSVKLSVVSQTGKEAVVGMLGAGEFFGEGSLRRSSRKWWGRRDRA